MPSPYRLTATVLPLLLAACSSPPKPPTVDDSKKRPVNVAQQVDLQACRTELTATRIVLTETVATPKSLPPTAAVLPMIAATPTAEAGNPAPNQSFIVNFELGSAEFRISADSHAELVRQARQARFILIRGRTDALTDSPSETRLAQRRAEAAFHYLVDQIRLPADGIRISWQGAGDALQTGTSPSERRFNRRVEIELYRVKPEIHLLTGPDSVGLAGT